MEMTRKIIKRRSRRKKYMNIDKFFIFLLLVTPVWAGEGEKAPPPSPKKNSTQIKKDYFVDKDKDGLNDKIKKGGAKVGDYIMDFLKKSSKGEKKVANGKGKKKDKKRRH